MRLPERAELKSLIALPCMIRKDRAGRAFFISDYPRRLDAQQAQAAAERLRLAGFELRPLGELMLIDWTRERCHAFYASLPLLPMPAYEDSDPQLWSLCRLLYQHEAALNLQDQALLHQALRLRFVADWPRLQRLLSEGLAEALRCRRAPPHHAARLLLSQGIDR